MSIIDILDKGKDLTYQQAYEAMAYGHKVQLSDWLGYWFMEAAPAPEMASGTNSRHILVFTRDGDILDTPFVERYRDRTDWQITDGKMGFDFAIRALKANKKVTREGWKLGQWRLYYIAQYTHTTESGNTVHHDAQIMQETYGGNSVKSQQPYELDLEDILAEDWTIA